MLSDHSCLEAKPYQFTDHQLFQECYLPYSLDWRPKNNNKSDWSIWNWFHGYGNHSFSIHKADNCFFEMKSFSFICLLFLALTAAVDLDTLPCTKDGYRQYLEAYPIKSAKVDPSSDEFKLVI